jgi:hypothetical protein
MFLPGQEAIFTLFPGGVNGQPAGDRRKHLTSGTSRSTNKFHGWQSRMDMDITKKAHHSIILPTALGGRALFSIEIPAIQILLLSLVISIILVLPGGSG